MRKFGFLVLICLFLVGCESLPRIGFEWPKSEKDEQIIELQSDLAQKEQEFITILEEKTQEIKKEESNRTSLGTSQVYAAQGTLFADPEPNKYVESANKALVIAKEALPIPKIEDVLEAMEIQKQLLSEQAIKIKEGEVALAEKTNEVIRSKQKVNDLEKEKEAIRIEKAKTEDSYNKELIKLAKERDEEKLALLQERDDMAHKWEKENSFWNKINPFHGLMKSFSAIFYCVIFIAVGGGILKFASILFPGVNVIQILIKSMGRIIGGILKLFVGWIPDALRGMGAVKYEDFKREKKLNENMIGAIQNFKDENIEDYKNKLKPKLQDWNKDNPELESVIDKKLKDLNQI